MRRDKIFYVMPMGDIWLVRAIGSSAEAYPTEADALAAAERLASRGARVRILSRSGRETPLPSLARTSLEQVAPEAQSLAS